MHFLKIPHVKAIQYTGENQNEIFKLFRYELPSVAHDPKKFHYNGDILSPGKWVVWLPLAIVGPFFLSEKEGEEFLST